MTSHWTDALVALGACEAAVAWARTQPDYETAWRVCERGDWLLWLAGRLATPGSDAHRAVVRAACACAETVLQYVPAGEDRPRRAIETARAWCDGTATVAQCRAAADDACATYAAACAADAAFNAATYAANAAIFAADACAYDAANAADAAACAARAANLRTCADLVRQHVSRPALLEDR